MRKREREIYIRLVVWVTSVRYMKTEIVCARKGERERERERESERGRESEREEDREKEREWERARARVRPTYLTAKKTKTHHVAFAFSLSHKFTIRLLCSIVLIVC